MRDHVFLFIENKHKIPIDVSIEITNTRSFQTDQPDLHNIRQKFILKIKRAKILSMQTFTMKEHKYTQQTTGPLKSKRNGKLFFPKPSKVHPHGRTRRSLSNDPTTMIVIVMMMLPAFQLRYLHASVRIIMVLICRCGGSLICFVLRSNLMVTRLI